MNAFSHHDLSHQNAEALRDLAVEQSQLLVVATKVIKKLEKIVESLTVELGAKNQKTLFAAESLEKMRHMHFGRSSERCESDHDSPLFWLFTQLSDASVLGGNDDESEPDPKPAKNPIKRGRTQQKKLAKTQVIHTLEAATTEARSRCKKIRSERLDFISEASPHLTKAYEKTLEELTEIAPVSGVAEISGEDSSRLWRIDFRRMKRLLKLYKIPEVTHISVDEVYARKKARKDETRNDRFFTIITDMKSRKVIWVTDSRRKEGLDAFYQKIGPEACSKIQVIAQDQHEDYRKSSMEHCKNATIVYDKFHVIKSFNKG